MAAEKKQPSKKKKAQVGTKSATNKLHKNSDSEDKTEEGFPVVGIGASAGGLEALEGFLRQLKTGTNMSFVIIQHRAPESKSVMVSLLEKYTPLTVTEIEDDMAVQPDCIYINAPHHDVMIQDGRFFCEESGDTAGARHPIDFFFRSLAKDRGEHAICIILSGTGTDGTLGLKEIKAAGGMAVAQEEKQAKYSAMPRSAIDTGLVDFILPVEKMPAELLGYVKHPYLETTPRPAGAEEKFENSLQQIFRVVRSGTGHDFSNYKRNTIRRRIERRMAVHQIPEIRDYIRFLRDHPAEVKTLFKDMIITVTNFFRDPDAFQSLKEKAIREIIRGKPLSSRIRVWIPGCATGQEAYSIAILFEEAMEELEKKQDLQIFASDVDEETIETARYGFYPDSISADVSGTRLNKYFTKYDSRYKIREQIREKLIFAKQDLIKDPPFSKLDLICCRNVLIYMDSELQKKIIPLFHYTLCPQGYLFLGSSETIGQFSDLFSPVDSKWKIFIRKPYILKPYEHPAIPITRESGDKVSMEPPPQKQETDTAHHVEKLILRDYSLPCVVVDEQSNVVYFNGDTSRFLAQPGGMPTTHILKMAKPEIHYTLNILLHKAKRENNEVKSETLQMKSDDKALSFTMLVSPIKDPQIKGDFFMVVFDIKTKAAEPSKARGKRPTMLLRAVHVSKPLSRNWNPQKSTCRQPLRSWRPAMKS